MEVKEDMHCKLVIEIEVDNAAFVGYRENETARILSRIARDLLYGCESDVYNDINGNPVATVNMIYEVI